MDYSPMIRLMRHCSSGDCPDDCPYFGEDNCLERLVEGAHNVIASLADKNRALRQELIVNTTPKGEDPSQKAKADAGKPRLTLIPPQILYDIAEVREYGCNKYHDGGPDNWKTVDIKRYRDALARHTLSYLAGPKDKDPESGLNHLKHIACNVAFLCQLEAENGTVK